MAITYAPKLRLAPLWPALAAIAVVAALAALLLPRPLADHGHAQGLAAAAAG